MPIDVNSPLWAVLADWIKIILTLPDPPPDQLTQLNDIANLTAVSALTEKLSPEVGNEFAEGSTRDPGPSQGRLGTGVLTAGCARFQITTRDGEDEQ
ncbi:MAG: hypothetical protein USCAAHI_01206 [Beijerinckiaceae bacterium]|jgi:hypothetical protein|nr:MAG: hypothetical protein USCAAHI_01206 [Beijerinckiaceae bacterium]